MATQGPNNGASFAQASAGADWVNPSNAGSSDNNYAVVTLNNTIGSKQLLCTNFGFSIPVGATIDGITVEVEGKSDTGTTGVPRARYIKAGMVAGTNKDGSVFGTSDAYKTFGGASDLWDTTWTPAEINASNFGVSLEILRSTVVVSVDHVRITVHYTVPTPTVNDTSTGSETRSLAGAAVKADTATGSETSVLEASTLTADTATGLEDTANAAKLTISDSSLDEDVLHLATELDVSDTASGNEGQLVDLLTTVEDVSAGSETLWLESTTVVEGGNAAGEDDLQFEAILSVSDSSAAGETSLTNLSATIADVAVGSESQAFQTITSVEDNTAQSSDHADGGNETIILDLSAFGADGHQFAADFTQPDAAESNETALGSLEMTVADTSASSEGQSFEILAIVTDAAAASEVLDLSGTAPVVDTSTGSDALDLTNLVIISDAATGIDGPTAFDVWFLRDDAAVGIDGTFNDATVLVHDSGSESIEFAGKENKYAFPLHLSINTGHTYLDLSEGN